MANIQLHEAGEQGAGRTLQNRYSHFNIASDNVRLKEECPCLQLLEKSCVLEDVHAMHHPHSAYISICSGIVLHLKVTRTVGAKQLCKIAFSVG